MVATILLVIVLVLAGLVLVVVEICTPTFGLLGLLSLACMIAAVYFCYTIGDVTGLVAMIAAIVGYPAFIVAAVKILPRTRFGHLLVLKRERSAPGEAAPETASLQQYVGQVATTQTALRPSGTIMLDGKRIVAQAESGMIDRGSEVKVVRSAGNYVVVRQVNH